MAVYDKSGLSHSETALAAVIYKSSQVRPHCHTAALLAPGSQAFASLPRPSSCFVWLALRRGTPMTQASLPPGRDRDFPGRGPHQRRKHQMAPIQDSYVLSPCPAPRAWLGKRPKVGSFLSPLSPQATSPSSDRHPPTSRWPPPSGWSSWSSESPCSRCTSPSGPSSEARPKVSPSSSCAAWPEQRKGPTEPCTSGTPRRPSCPGWPFQGAASDSLTPRAW